MGKLKNLTGQRFGKLTVIERADDKVTSSGKNYVQWKCKCDCGNIKIVYSSNLLNGTTQSCGCLRKDNWSPEDLINNRYGRLTVISRANDRQYKNGKTRVMWLCRCDCGNTIEVDASSLKSNHTLSCGCIQKEKIQERCLKDLTGQKFGRLTVLHRQIDNNKKAVCWLCRCECGREVVVQSSNLKSGHTTSCGCYKNESHGGKFKDLTGQRFGRLIVVKQIENKVTKADTLQAQWLCKCDCGNETVTITNRLLSGKTQSCGCLHKDVMTEKFQDDLTGMKFNSLTVIKRTDDYIQPNGRKRSKWLCKCDCGNYTEVYSEALKTGHTRSCGCQKSTGEYSILRYLDKNNIDYEYQKRFNDCCGTGNKPLSYDFYLPNQSLLIEYQGQQHYYPVNIYGGEEKFEIQQEHDRRKREYAKSNGYNLLEIPYYDYDNIEKILDKALSTSKVGNS